MFIENPTSGRRGGTKLYQNCHNHQNKLVKALLETHDELNTGTQPSSVEVNDLVSPMSVLTTGFDFSVVDDLSIMQPQSSASKSISTTPRGRCCSVFTSLTAKTTIYSNASLKELPTLLAVTNDHKNKDFKQHFMSNSTRQTSKQRQVERTNTQKIRGVKNVAIMIGSIFYKAVRDDVIALKKYKDASACAKGICELLGFSDACSGDQLINAFNTERVGMAPIRRGNQGKVNDEDAFLIAELIFTMSLIEQNNVDPKRLD